jgi:hypothetical protein
MLPEQIPNKIADDCGFALEYVEGLLPRKRGFKLDYKKHELSSTQSGELDEPLQLLKKALKAEDIDYAKGEPLYPILKDEDGKMIDGYHRQMARADWPVVTVKGVKGDKARYIACMRAHARRDIPKEEAREWVSKLAEIFEKDGVPIGPAGVEGQLSIPAKIAAETSWSVDTIRRLLKQTKKGRDFIGKHEIEQQDRDTQERVSKPPDKWAQLTINLPNVYATLHSMKGWYIRGMPLKEREKNAAILDKMIADLKELRERLSWKGDE